MKGRATLAVVLLAYVDALLETVRGVQFFGVLVAVTTVGTAVLGVRGTRGELRRSRLILAIAATAIVSTLAAGLWAETSGRIDRTSVLVAYDLVLIATSVAIAADRRWGDPECGAGGYSRRLAHCPFLRL